MIILRFIKKLRRLSDREFDKLVSEVHRVGYAQGFHDAQVKQQADSSGTGCILGGVPRDIEDIVRKTGF